MIMDCYANCGANFSGAIILVREIYAQRNRLRIKYGKENNSKKIQSSEKGVAA
jgi:hypothetical protein